jgi:epoxyqueuosine reductase
MRFPMPREYKHIRPVDKVRYGEPHFKEGLSVPEISIKYGSLASKMRTMPYYRKYLFGALREIGKAVKSIERNPYRNQTHITPQDMKELETYAKTLGIASIGFTKVKDRHMVQESIILFDNAMVFTMEMKRSEIELAPSIRTIQEVFRTYYELGKAVNLISDFLREKGFNAQPVPAIGNNLNLTVLARDAGIGGFGKNGLIITNELGPSVRLAAVLTDIENLPMNQELNHEWIKEFCNQCNMCVNKCPASAIYEHPIILPDQSEQHIDYKKCVVPFTKQNGCSICIKECTFFKSNYGKIKRAFDGGLLD